MDRQLRELSAVLLEHARRIDPAWTVADERDPGATLLALFAFLGETLLHRAAPIPERSPAAPPTRCGLQRVNYVEGVLLGLQDFKDEQHYFRERLRRHARALHGTGVVSGLQLSVAPDDGGQGAHLVVSPGLALAPTGELIEVCEEVTEALPKQGTTLIVQLRFAEQPARPAPIPDRPDDAGQAFTRIEEGFALALAPSLEDGAVAIGRLVPGARGWRVDRKFRPKRVRS